MINNLENILASIAKNAYISPETVTPFAAFTTDLSADASSLGDTVQVVVYSAGTAQEKQEGKAYVADASASTVPLQLNHRLYSAADISDITFSRMSPQARTALFVAATRKIAKKATDLINAAVKAATSESIEFAPTFAGIGAVKAAATAAGIEGELTLALSPAMYDALVADPDVAKIAASAGNPDVFTKGIIAQLQGLTVVRLPAAPEASLGFICPKSAIAVAARTTPLPDTQAGQVISDEASGLAFVHKFIENASIAAVEAITEIIFGAAVIDKKGVRLLTAKS